MKIKNNDQTSGFDDVNFAVDSKAGTVSASIAKGVSDDTAGKEADVEEPSDLELTADEQAAVLKACANAIEGILSARATVAPASTSEVQA